MGIPLLSGREFDSRDSEAAPKVVIVDETLAAQLWHGANPLGRSLQVQKTTMQVVGVARNSRYGSVWERPQPSRVCCIFAGARPGKLSDLAHRRQTRKTQPPQPQGNGSAILPHLPLFNFRTADELRSAALAPQRQCTRGFSALFGLSGDRACVRRAFYSSVSYAVARRTREIGIQLAVGAKPRTVVRQLIYQSMTVASRAGLAGTAISATVVQFVGSQVKGVSVYDGTAFAFVIALLGAVALLASAIPALRAARIDPQIALRSE